MIHSTLWPEYAPLIWFDLKRSISQCTICCCFIFIKFSPQAKISWNCFFFSAPSTQFSSSIDSYCLLPTKQLAATHISARKRENEPEKEEKGTLRGGKVRILAYGERFVLKNTCSHIYNLNASFNWLNEIVFILTTTTGYQNDSKNWI